MKSGNRCIAGIDMHKPAPGKRQLLFAEDFVPNCMDFDSYQRNFLRSIVWALEIGSRRKRSGLGRDGSDSKGCVAEGAAPPERTLLRKFKRMVREFGQLGLDVRALLDHQLSALA